MHTPASCPCTLIMLNRQQPLDGAASLAGLFSDVSRAQGDRRKLLDNDNDSDGEVRDCPRQCINSGGVLSGMTGCLNVMLTIPTIQLLVHARP